MQDTTRNDLLFREMEVNEDDTRQSHSEGFGIQVYSRQSPTDFRSWICLIVAT